MKSNLFRKFGRAVYTSSPCDRDEGKIIDLTKSNPSCYTRSLANLVTERLFTTQLTSLRKRANSMARFCSFYRAATIRYPNLYLDNADK